MYSETDLESAIAAGVLTPEAAAALRAHVAVQRASPMVDEEQFRLLSGFNDIFVAIAGVLVLVGAAWIGGSVEPALGAAAVTVCAWGLAEYFTRVRRMALPSIIFLIAFVGGVFATSAVLLIGEETNGPLESVQAIKLALAAALAGGGAWLHWRRFMVPITIAAGAAAAAGVALALVGAALGERFEHYYTLLLFGAGIAIFALAMRWDMSDRERKTRRSDAAFWLHLLAAPLIVHPAFVALAHAAPGNAALNAALVLGIYVALAAIALIVDRRALMVSALAYVLGAMGSLFNVMGAVSLQFAITALLIGSALLLLSAFWHSLRARLVAALPSGVAAQLPLVAMVPLAA